MLRHLNALVRAISDEFPVHVHGCPLLAGNHLDFCIQYPGYCKKLQHRHVRVRAVSDECSVHVHDCPLLAGNYLDFCIHYQ